MSDYVPGSRLPLVGQFEYTPPCKSVLFSLESLFGVAYFWPLCAFHFTLLHQYVLSHDAIHIP